MFVKIQKNCALCGKDLGIVVPAKKYCTSCAKALKAERTKAYKIKTYKSTYSSRPKKGKEEYPPDMWNARYC